MRFVTFDQAAEYFRGKTVAIVGSGPSSLGNGPGFVDSNSVVCRVNNYRVGLAQGYRCDVHYAFYGTSIKKGIPSLVQDGVRLCMCKLPNDHLTADDADISWHKANKKPLGIKFEYIYEYRKRWWFVDTFIPDKQRFMKKFDLLGKHQPTTGFAAILDILECEPASCFLTGFDGFSSGLHNVNEPWTEKNTDDPICHRPDLEMDWLAANAHKYPLRFDRALTELLGVAATL